MPQFAEGVHEIADLREGMILEGVVTNVTRFGAFVDVGVHQDGLVHVSELDQRFIKDPSRGRRRRRYYPREGARRWTSSAGGSRYPRKQAAAPDVGHLE